MATGGPDPLDQGAGPVGPPPGMSTGAVLMIPADVDFDSDAMAGRLAQVYTTAQQDNDAKASEMASPPWPALAVLEPKLELTWRPNPPKLAPVAPQIKAHTLKTMYERKVVFRPNRPW